MTPSIPENSAIPMMQAKMGAIDLVWVLEFFVAGRRTIAIFKISFRAVVSLRFFYLENRAYFHLP